MTKKRGIVLIAASVIFVIGVIIAILVAGCGKTADNKVSTADEIIATSVQTVTQVVTDVQGNTHIEEETMVVEVKQTKPSEQSEKATEANAQNIANSDRKQNNGSHNNSNNSNHNNSTNSSGNTQSSKSNSSSGQTSKSSGGTSSSDSSSQGKPSSNKSESSQTTQPAPAQQPTKDALEGKTWHDAEYKTEKVWVVDEEGYTWQKPIYETHDRTICNTCGADITDCVGEHGYNHLINGEDASYRNETVDTLVGYETVEEPEKGHWESKTTLVRPEGWY